MSNERIRSALISANMTMSELSERVGVDPKTVERWITKDRTPHRSHRLAVAAALGKDDGYLWPATAADERSRAASNAEVIALHANRGMIPVDTWTSLIAQARESIDLLAYAASFLHDSVPDFAERLASKARQGVRIRLAFGDPTSDAVAQRGHDEGIGNLLAARCELTWRYMEQLLDEPGVEARQHGCTLYTSVFRFDDDLLANTHIFGAAASQAPIIHVRHIPGGRLFNSYQQGFRRTWDQGRLLARQSVA